MTTTIDTRAAEAVSSALAKAGTDMSFEVLGTQSYDAATGKTTEGSPTVHTVKVVPPGSFQSFLEGQDGRPVSFFGTFISGAEVFTPSVGMKVTHDTVVYDIVRVGPIYSGDDVALWEVEVNR